MREPVSTENFVLPLTRSKTHNTTSDLILDAPSKRARFNNKPVPKTQYITLMFCDPLHSPAVDARVLATMSSGMGNSNKDHNNVSDTGSTSESTAVLKQI